MSLPSKDFEEFLARQKFWAMLGGGKIPVQAVPSKVEEIEHFPGWAPEYTVAHDRLAALGITTLPKDEIIMHMTEALHKKGGCIIFRFKEQTLLANLERIEK